MAIVFYFLIKKLQLNSNLRLNKQSKTKQLPISDDSFTEMSSDFEIQDTDQNSDLFTQSETTSESNFSSENSEKRIDIGNTAKKNLIRNQNSNSNFNVNIKNNFNISVVFN